jgi:tripartite-type tricarboxylate transporter receptor subunit TctC
MCLQGRGAADRRPRRRADHDGIHELAAYELNNWFGLFAPAGVLPAIFQVIHGAAVKALSSRELQQRLIEQGGIPMEG